MLFQASMQPARIYGRLPSTRHSKRAADRWSRELAERGKGYTQTRRRRVSGVIDLYASFFLDNLSYEVILKPVVQ